MTKKIVGILEFKELSISHQLDLLHADGVYVGKRRVDHFHVILFQLNGFYVEVFYKEYRKEIDHLTCSVLTDILHPYLDQINVRDLNKGKTN